MKSQGLDNVLIVSQDIIMYVISSNETDKNDLNYDSN